MAIFVKGNYIPNNYVHAIRSANRETDAKEFLMQKYRWNKSTITDIEWECHAQYIKRQTYSRKKTILNFIHRWLASGNKYFGQKLMCPNYRQQKNQDMDHDHFLTCSASGIRK